MQIRMTLVDPAGAGRVRDVVLNVASTTGLADVEPLLREALGPRVDDQRLTVDGRTVDDRLLLGMPPLVDGAVLTLGRAGTAGRAAGRVGGFVELHVVGGPDAGQVHPLVPGACRIGRAGLADLPLDDPDVSRWHARVDLGPGGVVVADLGSTNGTRVDGTPLGREPVDLTEGARLRLGSSTLLLRRPSSRRATTRATGAGSIDVNRPPRIRGPRPEVVVRRPVPPEPPAPARLPVLPMVLPLLVAVPLAVLWSPYALLFALMAPVVGVGTMISDRRSGRRTHGVALAGYREASDQAGARLADALADDLTSRRDDHPDPATVLRTAETPTDRLWERRRDDQDVLALRIGTATLPADVTVLDPADDQARPPDLDDAPVIVHLDRVGVLGVTGPRHRTLGLARSLIGQVGVLHSPRDVAVVLLVDRFEAAADWAWAPWLPHASPDAGGGVEAPGACSALVGADAEQVRRRLAGLDALITTRREHAPPGQPWTGPRVVVVLDGAGRLRSAPGLARLLEDGPHVGLSFVCLDDDPAALPSECRAAALLGGEVGTRARLRVTGDDEVDDVTADLAGVRWATRLARALAPLRDATPSGAGPGLPDRVRLLDALPPGATEAAVIERVWHDRPRSAKAMLGVTASGPYVVDLRLDGPHLLVAGTTGAGKSELLRTLIASLALANRPDELAFVLVDYKGGAAFSDCARLPHTVGLVTDLDGHLTQRALTSLQAEVRRRERLLRDAGAADLEAYLALVDAGSAPRLPRLVLVVDEFRVLAEELPDFVAGLVRLAAVGRSLGLHVVLATQRPGGAVSADMRANVNLRIALRVRDAVDSTDVVDAVDAAGITPRTPGRAYVRTGAGPLLAVQTGYVSGSPVTQDTAGASVHVTSVTGLGEPPPATLTPGSCGPSDLSTLVTTLGAVARSVGAAPVPSPWLEPLPELVLARDVADVADVGDVGADTVAYGLVDSPAAQRREPLQWHPRGCLTVVGTGRSGRTTTLRSLVVAAAQQWSAADLGVYVLDGGGGLAGLAELPHVGAVVPRDDTERTTRVLRLLTTEIARRATDPDGGHGRLLLVVDGWESLRAVHDELEGPGLDAVLQVVREGPAVGVLTLLAGDRSVLMGAVGGAVAERLVLRTADPTDAVLAGVPARDVPAHLPPGRGLRVGADGVREVQVAVLDPADVRTWPPCAASSASGPRAVPPMPDRVPAQALDVPAGSLLLGVGGDDVRPVALDPADDGPVVLVAGHPRSGRSTTLLTLAGSLTRTGRPVVVVTARRSPLELLSDVLGQFRPGDGVALTACLADARQRGAPAVVVVDDVELVDRTSIETELVDLLARAESSGELCLLAGSTPDLVARFSGVGVEARRRGVGVLLGPVSPLDGDLFGVRVPRRPERRPGRGLLVRRGEMVPVQVAQTSQPPRDPQAAEDR